MWFCCSITDGKRTCTPNRCTVSFKISSFFAFFGRFCWRQSHESFYTKCPKKNSFSLDRIFCFICLFLKYTSISVQKFKNKRFYQVQWDKFRIWMLLQLRLIVKVFGNTFVMKTQKSFFLCWFKQIKRDVHCAHKNANSSKCIHLSRNYLTILLRFRSFLHMYPVFPIQCIYTKTEMKRSIFSSKYLVFASSMERNKIQ